MLQSVQVLLSALAVLTLLFYLRGIVDIWTGKRRIVHIADLAPIADTEAPSVSIVVPACNEEDKMEKALRSVLAQAYPRLEVIAVNDRSVDRTGAILDRLAQLNPILKPVHISELPAGWLGKNHALNTGANRATGQWILFADADVVMDPTAVARALRYATEQELDHLAVAPHAEVGGFLSKAFLGGFALTFSMLSRPWRVRDPRAKEFIGIGAFNLVRASAYRSVGGHSAIALRPDDDLKLGRLIKQSGFRSDFALGTELLRVAWYASFAELRRGLMKNFFSVFQYDPKLAILACLFQIIVFAWPPVGAIVTSGAPSYLNMTAVVLAWTTFAANCGMVKLRPWWGITLPLAGVLMAYLIARAMVVTLRSGCIEWRGTRYSIDDLKSNRF
jgi:glycosyltransferase involved in cell wall biosynthesis